MKIAVEGCSHGELDAIYASVLRTEREQNFKVDLLLLCGDFQAIRNHADLNCLAVPAKYKRLGSFHRYYSGEKVAPLLTLVIGGNHEASNYMWELYHGGWLAPNIYYLGAAGAVQVAGLTIAGASGIFKRPDYKKGRFERMPFDNSSIRSTYHTRKYDIHRLKLLDTADVVMSHDWPNMIERHGDTAALIKKKPFFAKEIKTATLGSPPLMELMETLKPPYWFSAHLHVKFAALYRHGHPPPPQTTTSVAVEGNPEAIDISLDEDKEEDDNPDEIAIEDDDDLDEDPKGGCDHTQTEAIPVPETTSPIEERKETRFLALNKCLPQSDFLQFLDISAPEDTALNAAKEASPTERVYPSLRFSKRWLAITRALHPQLSLGVNQPPLLPITDVELRKHIEKEEGWITANLPTLDVFPVQRFIRTAPAPFEPGGMFTGSPSWFTNPQTEAFCHFLQIPNKINPHPSGFLPPPPPVEAGVKRPREEQEPITTLEDDVDGPDKRWGEGAG